MYRLTLPEFCAKGHKDWAVVRASKQKRVCTECRRIRARARYAARTPQGLRMLDLSRARAIAGRALVNQVKASGCVDCGEKDIRCLDLDHVRGEKLMPVSLMVSYARSRMMAEIAKCEVRCANCHRKRTAERREAVA